MIYEEPLVWRPGQAMSASEDGTSVIIDMAFTDYVINITSGEVVYARPSLRAYTPTVNIASSTITMTAPEVAWPHEPSEDINGVMIYAHSAFYSAGSPVPWDYTEWNGTGYAFRIGNILYIFSGLFCKDYKFTAYGYGRCLVNDTINFVTYPTTAWTNLDLYSLNTVVQLDGLTNKKSGGLAKRDISSGDDPETVVNIGDKAVKCGWTAILDGSDKTITQRFQSEDDTIDVEQDVVASGDDISVNIVTTGKAILVGYTSYIESSTVSAGTATSTLSLTLDADIPKTCQVFTFGNYAPNETGCLTLVQADIRERIDRTASWDRIFPSARIYDRGENDYGAFTVLTDSMEDSFTAMTLAEDNALGLSHWRNSVTGFNIIQSASTGAYEFVPASSYNDEMDAEGNALSSTAVLRRDICAVIVTALENAGIY